MGQKVNPHGLRVGVIKDWDSRWYAREDKVGDLIVEDYKIRQFLKKTLYSAGVPTIEIERDSAKVRIYIHCSRPGVVIGKDGKESSACVSRSRSSSASPLLSPSSRFALPTPTHSWSLRTLLSSWRSASASVVQ